MGTLTAALESTKGVKKKESLPKTDKITMLHFSKLHRSKFQYSDKGKTAEEYQAEVIALSDELEADGKVLEPIIVRKSGVDDYEIIAGQHRRDASEHNVIVKSLTSFEFVPCIIVNMTDAQAEYATFSSNKTWNQSDWHIMHEIERKKYLLENFPEDFPHIPDKGRMIEKLALEMNMPKSTVGEYLQISKNLSDSAMEAFEHKELNKSAAVAMAGLSHTEQDKLISSGVTKQKDIKAYKDEVTEKTTHRVTITDTVKTVKSTSDATKENVPNFGTKVAEEENVPNFGTDVLIENVVPDYSADNGETEELQQSNEELKRIIEERTGVSKKPKPGKCDSMTCKGYDDIADTFVFYNKRYCMNCLYDLIMDLADTGVITLDTSAMETKGIVIHS